MLWASHLKATNTAPWHLGASVCEIWGHAGQAGKTPKPHISTAAPTALEPVGSAPWRWAVPGPCS